MSLILCWSPKTALQQQRCQLPPEIIASDKHTKRGRTGEGTKVEDGCSKRRGRLSRLPASVTASQRQTHTWSQPDRQRSSLSPAVGRWIQCYFCKFLLNPERQKGVTLSSCPSKEERRSKSQALASNLLEVWTLPPLRCQTNIKATKSRESSFFLNPTSQPWDVSCVPLGTSWKLRSSFTGDFGLLLFGLGLLPLLFCRYRFPLFDIRAAPTGAGAVVWSLHFTRHRAPWKIEIKRSAVQCTLAQHSPGTAASQKECPGFRSQIEAFLC